MIYKSMLGLIPNNLVCEVQNGEQDREQDKEASELNRSKLLGKLHQLSDEQILDDIFILKDYYMDILRKYRILLYATQSIVFECDLDNDTFLSHLDNWTQTFGYLPRNYEEAVQQGYELCHVDDMEAFYQTFKLDHVQLALTQGEERRELEYRVMTPQGVYKWLHCTLIPIANPTGKIVRIIAGINDIGMEKHAEESIRFQATHDSLTGMLNRGAGQMEISQYLSTMPSDSKGAFVMLDMDDFKSINDYYGHLFGDHVLTTISAHLSEQFSKDSIHIRMGGDEFAVFIKRCTSEEELMSKLEHIKQKLDEGLSNDEKLSSLGLTISMGVAPFPTCGLTFSELYKCADSALFRAKDTGKNQIVMYDEKCKRALAGSLHINHMRNINRDNLSLLDEMDDIVYITDPETYDMIYMNRAGKMTGAFSDRDMSTMKCYKYIQNLDQPCEFCTNHLLSEDKFYVWEHFNKFWNRRYLVKDKLVRWDGRPAKLEIAIDITNYDSLKHMLSSKVEIENVLLECINMLVYTNDFQQAIHSMLTSIGKFYGADRAYIMKFDEATKGLISVNEWYAPGKKLYSKLPLGCGEHASCYWNAFVQKEESVWVSDAEAFKHSDPKIYECLNNRQIHSLYTVVIKHSQSPIGFIGIDNPSVHIDDITLLHSLSRFVENEIAKRRMRQKQEFAATHDLLTGALNHNSFYEYLTTQDHKKLDNMGIIVANVNGLRQINRNHGQKYGDLVIKQAADTLMSYFGEGKLYRFSGDEFVVIYENIAYDSFMSKVDCARKHSGETEETGFTIGATWSDTDMELNELISHASELMIIQKQQYYIHASATSKHHQPSLIRSLLDAIRDGMFLIYLQPKVEVSDKQIVGAEALIRLTHPQYGIVPPIKFIPLLEEEKVIRYIDLFVLEEVCKTLEGWKQQGIPLIPISLNFSRLTILENNIVETVCLICDKYDVSRERIEIEITETLGEMEREVIAKLSVDMKEQGFRITLDDFGSQYSSLSLLSFMDFYEMKIDRSLINGIVHNPKSVAVVKHVIEMCRTMNMKCIAEGVETIEQYEVLKELECEMIQGYLFGKPMPVNAFEALQERRT